MASVRRVKTYFRCLHKVLKIHDTRDIVVLPPIPLISDKMNDPGLNNLLKWGIQNSQPSHTDSTASTQPAPRIDTEALRQLLGGFSGPSDAQLMVESMDVIDNNEAKLEDKCVAFENFEQLIEGLDNANNLENLGLWTRLIKHLHNEIADLRMYAAWCCGIAVQNNIKTQERVCIV